jgi:hypothetical protein
LPILDLMPRGEDVRAAEHVPGQPLEKRVIFDGRPSSAALELVGKPA